MLSNHINQKRATDELGIWFMINSRTNMLYHVSWITKLKMIYLVVSNGAAIQRRLEMFVDQIENGEKLNNKVKAS